MSGDFDNHALKQLPWVCDWRARTHWIWPQSPDSRLRGFFSIEAGVRKWKYSIFVDIMSIAWAPAVVAHSYCVSGLDLQVIIVQTVRKRRSRHWTGKRHESHKTQLSVTRRQLSSLYLFFCAEVTPEHQSFCQLSGLWSRPDRILTASRRFVVSCCDESMSFSLRRCPLKRGSIIIIYCSARIP